MRSVLRNRRFRLLFAADLTSLLGDMILFVALPFHVYQATGSALATSAAFVARTIPQLLAPLAGAAVDRFDRRRLVPAAQLTAAAALSALLAPGALESTWAICAASVIESAGVQVVVAAVLATVPAIVAPDELVAANAVRSSAESITLLVGPVLGALLLGAFGIETIVALDAATYLLAAALLAGVLVEGGARAGAARPRGAPARLRPRPPARPRWPGGLAGTIVAVSGLAAVGEGMLSAGLVPFAAVQLDGGPQTLSWLVAAVGGGTLAGAVATAPIVRRAGVAPVLMLAPLFAGGFFLVVARTHSFATATALFALAAFAGAIASVTETSVLQGSVPASALGRLAGVFTAARALGRTAGLVLAGALAPLLGIAGALSVAAAAFASGTVVWSARPAALRRAAGIGLVRADEA